MNCPPTVCEARFPVSSGNSAICWQLGNLASVNATVIAIVTAVGKEAKDVKFGAAHGSAAFARPGQLT
jgi:hypothetical protein